MELHVSLSILFLLFFTFKFLQRYMRAPTNLPPSPPSMPIIGHLHHLQVPLHRNFHKLSSKYGPVISLWFGSRLVIVISSAAMVEECFSKNDVVLANRPPLLTSKYVAYNNTTMATSPYGEHWRNLRRIGAIEIFSSSRLNTFTGIRRDEVNRLLRKISRNSTDGFTKVNLQSAISELTFNISMRMAAGKRYFGDEVTDEEEAQQFGKLVKQITALGGVSNPGDFLPILNWIPNGVEKRIEKLGKRTDAFLQGLIDEHRRGKKEGRNTNTMIDHLLSLQESDPDYYGDHIIKGFILVLLLAGTETSAVTIEWAMSHLLNNPDTLEKAMKEIDSQIGQERLVEESDVLNLQYLQGIISETLRLNPAAPMLLPHFTSNKCTISGYDIPRDTIILVNAWAIHREPDQWEEPTCFKPERWEKSDARKLLAFGVGRRACPGSGMAQRVVGLTLASLIQCIEWKRIGDEEIEMSEGRGTTMPKVVPLEAMCKVRPIFNKHFGV